jgi:sirohydrochlorin ferrochelatase
MSRKRRPLVLVAHGSRDARVETAFLDFEGPGLAAALTREAARGQRAATVVPLLLTSAYHGRVDVPGEISKVDGLGLAIGLAPVLGPVAGRHADAVALRLLVGALRRRLDEVVSGPVDAVVLAAAGTTQVPALATVDLVADALGADLGVPCLAGYASGAGRRTGAAVAALRAGGARRVALSAYFLSPGLLYDRVVAEARAVGVTLAAAPMGDAPEVAELVLRRADTAA